jgi:hypothetical protein
LYTLAGYLLFAGVARIAVPQFALKLLLPNGDYGDVFPRLTGIVLMGTSYPLDRRQAGVS